MDRITDTIIKRLAAGEDRHRLSFELTQRGGRIKQEAGFRYHDSRQPECGILGSWDIKRLREATQQAKKAGRLTPLRELRDAEVAAVYLRYIDMNRPNAVAALQAAQEGRNFPFGGFSESRQMELHLADYAHGRTSPRPSGHIVEFRL